MDKLINNAKHENTTASAGLYTNTLGNTTVELNDLYDDYIDASEDSERVRPVDTILIVICVLGIAANGMSIVLVTRLQRKLTFHLKLVTSLCVSDALIVIMTLLRTIVNLTQPINLCFNVSVRLAVDLALLATLINLLAIAADHYLAIMKPSYRSGMTSSRANCILFGIWTICALGIMIEVVSGAVDRYENESLCEAIAYDKVNVEFGIVIFIILVLCIICLIYGRLGLYFHRNESSKSIVNQNDSSSPQAFVTTSIFVWTFILFWLPIGIFNVYIYTQTSIVLKDIEKYIEIGNILFVLLLLNTIADPIVYTLRLPVVREKYFRSLEGSIFNRPRESIKETIIC